MNIVWIVIVLVVGVLVYVRFAPHNIARWHRASVETGVGETRLEGGYIWRRDVGGEGPAMLAKLDRVIRETPRTQVLSGSVEDGQVSYVSRSKWVGFPDYITVTLEEGVLEIYSRLRFGRSDMGVNRKRVRSWIDQL